MARWGEQEREPARQMYGRYSHGLALNRIAHYDCDNIDDELAAKAKQLMTDADLHVLAQGG